jgi:hypothetical protein
MPALDYLENKDTRTDRKFRVSRKHLDIFAGMFQQIAVYGPDALTQSQLKRFIGDDARHGMCEFRVIVNQGHRMLCFKRRAQTLVVACGFRKPAQMETPSREKARALQVLHEHEAREAEDQKKPRN